MMDLSTLRISKELVPDWLKEHGERALSVQDTVRMIIETRRSVRQYADRPVSRKTIEELLDIANWAPSPENLQNRRIVVVRSPGVMDEIKRLLARAFDAKVKPRLDRAFADNPKVVQRTGGFFSTLGGAPVMIFVFAVPSGHGMRIDMQSAAAWTQNFLLAAHSQGLATCWFAGVLYCEDEIRRLLNVEDLDLVTGITLGYPAKTRLYVPRRKTTPGFPRWID